MMRATLNNERKQEDTHGSLWPKALTIRDCVEPVTPLLSPTVVPAVRDPTRLNVAFRASHFLSLVYYAT